MNYSQKQAIVQLANERRGAVSDSKGPEYAGQADAYQADDQDVLANFKRQDARWGYDGSGLCSAFLYFGKHLDSIETFARSVKGLLAVGDLEAARALGEKGEGIISRLDDARNYIDLIECLLVDADLHPVCLPGFFLIFDDDETPGEPAAEVWNEGIPAGPTEAPCGPDCSCFPPEDWNENEAPSNLPPELRPSSVPNRQSPDEPLYHIDGSWFVVTEEEGRALLALDVRPINFRAPKKGDLYLYVGPFGTAVNEAFSDHSDEDGDPALILPQGTPVGYIGDIEF